MKIYQYSAEYPDYSFPTVSLAYFLRYPNPYSKHVMSTDTICQHIDPSTKRLHTLRLHLKQSKVPVGILKFLPKSMSGPDGESKTYILEKSVVDVQQGWMETESRNMEWTGVLSVIEKQLYKDNSSAAVGLPGTTCKTTVTFVSRLGENIRKRRRAAREAAIQEDDLEDEQPKQGWLASWSTAGIQRTIELVGVKRTKTALVNSSEGMKVVLERLRSGGIKGVLEGMRHDRMEMMGMPALPENQPAGMAWKDVWRQGNRGTSNDHDDDD